MNLHRRDLTSSQKATVAVDVEKLLADEAKERQRANARATANEKIGNAIRSQKEAGASSNPEFVPGSKPARPQPQPEAREQAAKIVGTNPRYVSDAKKVADLARAAETYARLQQLGEEAVSHARAICVDALALMGEMLKVSEKNTGAKGSVVTGSKREPVKDTTPTLADQGISKKQSSTAQALAVVKERKPELFEQVKAGKVTVAAARVELKLTPAGRPASARGPARRGCVPVPRARAAAAT